MVTRINVNLQSGNFSVYWLWLLLDVSAVNVMIVICDVPRQEFSLCERVYIHNTYTKSRKSCSETRRKFRVKFPGRPVPNPRTIRRQAKRFKETGSVKNRKVNRRRHVFTEETLDEFGEWNNSECLGAASVCGLACQQAGQPRPRATAVCSRA